MQTSADEIDRKKIWDLIKGAHSALLVSIAEDGSLIPVRWAAYKASSTTSCGF